MHILVVEPFFGGSHKQWAEEWKKYSRHHIEIVGLPGKYWKWRMMGSAPVLVSFMKEHTPPDLIVYSSMTNVATVKGLLPLDWQNIPTALYMHENQLVYPRPSRNGNQPKRNAELEVINVLSCLAADRIFFNSHFHMTSFLKAVPSFLNRFPDARWIDQTADFEQKSEVLYVGIEPPDENRKFQKESAQDPIILWNHRWEFDKGPIAFFKMLLRLKERKLAFQLIATGQVHHFEPAFMKKVHHQLADRIVHWGFVEDKKSYYSLLCRANLLPVTSEQDFFGISVIEAIARGLFPLLPNRLAYPEHIPPHLRDQYLYKDIKDLEFKLTQYLEAPQAVDKDLQIHVARYYWPEIIETYDRAFESVSSS